jgi:signal transduction histidine kinase
MRQVVDALVFGAIQASDKWSMVQLHLDFDEMRGDLLLSIVSSGASVLPSQGYLLTQFWNSDDYRLKLQEGPGIELAFAKAMIQFLNGSVRFEHSTSFPSRLVVRFPANRSFLLKVFS